VASLTEEDAETMPTQKTFKQRVRARMTKTGESYTAARRHLLRKAPDPKASTPEATATETSTATPESAATATLPPARGPVEIPADALLVADESMVRATGKGHADWFALLDAWGATGHNHTEIARWLAGTYGTPGWWTQNITVAYERTRGMRARHQMADGFSVSVTRTIATDSQRALSAFMNEALRRQWLPDVPMRQRPTRAALTARFDWPDPPSRVIVAIVPKGEARSVVAVAHEQLPDAETGDRLKTAWRGWLGDLKAVLERA
jgi:hypothetical protein